MRKEEIKEGINLWLLPEDKFKSYYAAVFLHTPLKKETATENALIPLLLKRGSKNYPTKREISEKLDMLLGASLNAYVSKRGEEQMIAFSVSGPSDKYSPFGGCFSEALNLMFDIAFNHKDEISEEYLNGEKIHLSEIIESEKNDKRAYASSRCREEMCKGESYAVPENGYASEIQKITPESIEKRIKEVLSSSVIDIIIAGSFDEREAISSVRALTKNLSPRSEDRPVTTAAENKGLTLVTEEMKISQGKLCIGFTCPVYDAKEDEYAAMLLYNAVFGGGASSKLFLNVREKLSLAYYAGSLYNREKGIILVSSGIECKNFEKTKEEIMLQHKAMTEGNISKEELDTAKKSLVNSYMSVSDSLKSTVSFNLLGIMNKSLCSPYEMVQRINRVSLEDISKIAPKVEGSLIYFLKGEEQK